MQSVITTKDADPDPTPQQISTSFPIRYALSITTDIGLPAKFDTLAIVSIFLPESLVQFIEKQTQNLISLTLIFYHSNTLFLK